MYKLFLNKINATNCSISENTKSLYNDLNDIWCLSHRDKDNIPVCLRIDINLRKTDFGTFDKGHCQTWRIGKCRIKLFHTKDNT